MAPIHTNTDHRRYGTGPASDCSRAPRMLCHATAEAMDPIGYQMEALTAVRTVSVLCKSVDREMTITNAKVPGRHVEQSRSWIANTGTNHHD